MPLSVGDSVQRYVVERVNPDSTSFVVRHTLLGSQWLLRLVAVRGPSHAASVLESARHVARLSHPNVLRVIDWLEIDGQPALLHEHVEGASLPERKAAGLSEDSALRLARGMLRGLAAAHAQGIVHGALSPSAIAVGPGEVPRLMGFGTWVPDPAFCPPEGGTPEIAHDVFAAAAIVRWLFQGLSEPAPVTEVIARGTAPAALRAPSVEALWETLTGTPLPRPPAPERAEVVPASFASPTFPRLTPSHATSHLALPAPRRPLIGRAGELEALIGLLAVERLPGSLVTLVGTAGVGKTRLALEVAQRNQRQGLPVLWVDLQATVEVEDALTQMAWTLGDTADGSAQSVGRSLARRGALLLVLDNVDQLPAEFAQPLAQIREVAPASRILCTSRGPLGVPGEQLFELSLLPFSEAAPRQSDAWKLLTLAAPEGALDLVDDALASALLRELEGLPLALELAGGRLEVLEPAQLLARFDRRFAVLAAPDAVGRHRGLYEALASSWEALAQRTRQVLARLSVLVGPFDLATASAISGEDDIEPHLDQLVRRSLVSRIRSRFQLLVAIRDFAGRTLSDSERAEAMRAHARWWARQADRWQGRDREVIAQLEVHAPDLVAVLERAEKDNSLISEALGCVVALAWLHHIRGPIALARARLDRALALPGGTDEERSALHLHRASFRRLQRDLAGSVADFRFVLDRAETLPVEHVASAWSHAADLYEEQGQFERALEAADRGIALAASSGLRTLLAHLEVRAGNVLGQLGRLEEARDRHARARQAVPDGDLATELEVHKNVAWLELLLDDLPAARVSYERVLELASALENRRATLTSTAQLGLIAEAEGRLLDAEQAYLRAAEGMKEWGDPTFVGYYRGLVGRLHLRRGEPHKALVWLREASALVKDTHFADLLRVTEAVASAASGGPEGPPCKAEWQPVVDAIRAASTALDRGERATGRQALAAVTLPVQSDLLVRAAVEVVLGQLRAALDAWWFAPGGAWLEPPSAPRLWLGPESPRARILAALLERRQKAPGERVGAQELVAAGWPGERIVARAASNRLHVALSDLRRGAGLPFIGRGDDGWCIEPELPLQMRESWRVTGP